MDIREAPGPGAVAQRAVDSAGRQGNGYSAAQSISADGRFVAFSSYATNLVPGDTNGQFDVFVHDRETGKTERVENDGAGQVQNQVPSTSISADGRHVTFMSSAYSLVPGDTNGVFDIFVHDRETGKTERVSLTGAGAQANGHSARPSISADGHHVAFVSSADNLVPGDTNGVSDVFAHARAEPTPVDCTITGTPGDDVLSGTPGPDVICGLGGDDEISGRSGDDVLRGGEGDDAMSGGAGADRLEGEAGADKLSGSFGDDTLSGGADDDQLYGREGADDLSGDDGNDSLLGSVGDDRLSGGADDDELIGAGGRDELSGGDGDDRLDAVSDNDESEDRLRCGGGLDTASRNPEDLVSSSCERR